MVEKTLLATVLTVAAAAGTRSRGNALTKRSMVLALALLASGCGGKTETYSQTETKEETWFKMFETDVRGSKIYGETCYAEVNSYPDSIAAKEILPLDGLDNASNTQLASTARPTPDQMRKIVAYKQNLDRCNERIYSNMRFSVVGLYTLSQKRDQNLNSIIVDLAQKKLNLGGAAQAARLESQRFQAEAKALVEQTVALHTQQRNAEIAQRNAELAQRQAAQAQGQADMAKLGAQMQQGSYQFQQQQQYLKQSQSFQPPQVMQITQPGGNQIRCINVGIVTNCRY